MQSLFSSFFSFFFLFFFKVCICSLPAASPPFFLFVVTYISPPDSSRQIDYPYEELFVAIFILFFPPHPPLFMYKRNRYPPKEPGLTIPVPKKKKEEKKYLSTRGSFRILFVHSVSRWLIGCGMQTIDRLPG